MTENPFKYEVQPGNSSHWFQWEPYQILTLPTENRRKETIWCKWCWCYPAQCWQQKQHGSSTGLPVLDRSSPDHNKRDYFTSAQSAMLRAGASGCSGTFPGRLALMSSYDAEYLTAAFRRERQGMTQMSHVEPHVHSPEGPPDCRSLPPLTTYPPHEIYCNDCMCWLDCISYTHFPLQPTATLKPCFISSRFGSAQFYLPY